MINLFLPNKKTLILLAGLGVFILVLALISLFSNPIPPAELQPNPLATPAPLNNLPSLNRQAENSLPQIYKNDSLEKNYQRIINKKPLTPEEVNIKLHLISPLKGSSGIIITTDDFIVEYLPTPQYFMIQILSNDIESAKKNAQKWFNNQGISIQGVCNLPVIFYFSERVSNYLTSNNLQFDPTPEGCE